MLCVISTENMRSITMVEEVSSDVIYVLLTQFTCVSHAVSRQQYHSRFASQVTHIVIS